MTGIHPHFVFELLGYAAGTQTFLALRRRSGDVVALPVRLSVAAAAAVGAAFGAHLLFLLQAPSLTWVHRGDPAWLFGGKTIVGGILGGLAAVEAVKLAIGERRSTGDLFALPLCAGIAVGRVGCFLSGLQDATHGIPTALPWGVDLGDGVARHPVQLYEIAWLAVVSGFCVWRRRHLARDGDAFKAFVLLYLLFRLLVDFLKPGPRDYLGLTGIQVSCLLGLAAYAPHARRVLGPGSSRG